MDDWLNPIVGVYDPAVLGKYSADKPHLGVSGRLKEAFPDCKIYTTDDVKQGLEEPCFFIADLDYSEIHLADTHYEFEYSLDIHYFPPKNTEKYNAIRKMKTVVIDIIEYITVLDPSRMETFTITGKDRRSEESDGVLHVFVTYGTRFYKPKPADPTIETLSAAPQIKSE
ncbi:MAG: hypothetical protein LBU81_00870 [Methanosarcinales archaeon]|jgi:hypothetical protein|nr:hypothetical protein [Methanosarcinales archaeon]